MRRSFLRGAPLQVLELKLIAGHDELGLDYPIYGELALQGAGPAVKQRTTSLQQESGRHVR